MPYYWGAGHVTTESDDDDYRRRGRGGGGSFRRNNSTYSQSSTSYYSKKPERVPSGVSVTKPGIGGSSFEVHLDFSRCSQGQEIQLLWHKVREDDDLKILLKTKVNFSNHSNKSLVDDRQLLMNNNWTPWRDNIQYKLVPEQKIHFKFDLTVEGKLSQKGNSRVMSNTQSMDGAELPGTKFNFNISVIAKVTPEFERRAKEARAKEAAEREAAAARASSQHQSGLLSQQHSRANSLASPTVGGGLSQQLSAGSQGMVSAAAPPLPARNSSSNEWACSACTYLNPIAKNRCELCDSARTGGIPPAPLPPVQLSSQQQLYPQASSSSLTQQLQSVTQTSRGKRGRESEGDEAEGGDDEDDSKAMCTICLAEKKNTIFIPCGHYCCCSGCAAKVKECPICRKKISKKQKVFE